MNDPLFVRGRRFITYGTTEKGGCSVWALETILTVQQDPNAGNSRIAVISKKKKKKKKRKLRVSSAIEPLSLGEGAKK